MKMDDDSTAECTKNYEHVTKGRGNCFLMLVSCLRCEHVLGGHLVQGAEGRCDVLNSMVTSMAKVPEVIVYDNACNLAASTRRWAPAWACEVKQYAQ